MGVMSSFTGSQDGSLLMGMVDTCCESVLGIFSFLASVGTGGELERGGKSCDRLILLCDLLVSIIKAFVWSCDNNL